MTTERLIEKIDQYLTESTYMKLAPYVRLLLQDASDHLKELLEEKGESG